MRKSQLQQRDNRPQSHKQKHKKKLWHETGYPTQGQDPASVQAQNMEENEVQDAKDTNDMQVQVGNTDSQVNDEQQGPDIPEDQTSRALQDDNY